MAPGESTQGAGYAMRSRRCRSAPAPISCSSTCPKAAIPLNDINGLAEVCEPGTVVIAAGQVNDVRLYRDLVASGIQDYILKPLKSRRHA